MDKEKLLTVPESESLAVVDQAESFVDLYAGISIEPFSEKIQKVLSGKIDSELIEIRPDGLLYYPGVRFRNKLHEAFGRGGWAVRPVDLHFDKIENSVFYHGILYVLGRFIAESIGEQEYFPKNKMMSYATATEGAKTDCLTRCCKDLGIAQELWDPTFIVNWKADHAVKVWCEYVGKDDRGKDKFLWRKSTAPEIGWPYKESKNKSSPAGNNPPPPPKTSEPTPRQKLENGRKWFNRETGNDDIFFTALNKHEFDSIEQVTDAKIENVLKTLHIAMDELLKSRGGK